MTPQRPPLPPLVDDEKPRTLQDDMAALLAEMRKMTDQLKLANQTLRRIEERQRGTRK